MAEKTINRLVRGVHAVDGAGVHLVRVLGHDTVKTFDPFLMLDSFDSENPEDYVAGFPFHPHRGIETITYLIEGEIDHEDSLGNVGHIGPGQSQWMTAGSGIMHQEMPRACPRMLGLQLWLNLPAKDKMAEPRYFDITNDMVGEVETEDAVVRVLSGAYAGVAGVRPGYVPASIYDVTVKPGRLFGLDTKAGENVSLFLILGGAVVCGQRVAEKTAVNFSWEGEGISVAAPQGGQARFIYLSGPPLREPVAWGGPIVMNTSQELREAFKELEAERFIKHEAHW